MQDRNISYGENTILWREFCKLIGIPNNISLDSLLNCPMCFKNDKEEVIGETISFSHVARSIIKLQNLGVLQCDFKMTLGASSLNNIDRFHVTHFGQKLIDYIDCDKTPKRKITVNIGDEKAYLLAERIPDSP